MTTVARKIANLQRGGQDLERSTFQGRPCYRYIRQSDNLPTIGQVLDLVDPIVKVKLFDPTGNWSWYIAAYDPDTRIAYGLVDGFDREVGDIYMPELVTFRGRFGLPIERDQYWKPCRISEVA